MPLFTTAERAEQERFDVAEGRYAIALLALIADPDIASVAWHHGLPARELTIRAAFAFLVDGGVGIDHHMEAAHAYGLDVVDAAELLRRLLEDGHVLTDASARAAQVDQAD